MMSFRQYLKEQDTQFMKKLDILRDQGFIVREGNIAGDNVFLVYPAHMGVEWTKDNLIYRSSVWNEDGKLISAGFKKFFNWTEQPKLVPEPKSLKDAYARLKMDGSLLIISKYKGVLIHRTRGTLNAEVLDTGNEINILKEKYPKVFDNDLINSERYSILCEWVSPNNKIVIDYGDEVDMYLVGIVHHEGYKLMTQHALDKYGQEWGIKRPEAYKFENIPTMLKSIKALKGKEGICLYYRDQQDIKKIKSIEYLAKHAFRSNLSIGNMIDLYLQWEMPDYEQFMRKIKEEFDFECAEMAKELVVRIINTREKIEKMLSDMRIFITSLYNIPRKEAATRIFATYGKTNRTGLVFMLLDNKPIRKNIYKKLFYELLKKNENV